MVDESELVRRQSFDVDRPLELELGVGSGLVEIRLTEEPGAAVEVRHHPAGTPPWGPGIVGLLNWFSGQFGDADDSPTAAIEATEIELIDDRLLVRTPTGLPLRAVALAVTVRAPAHSHVEVRSGSADVRVTGASGRVSVSTGSGDVRVERADGKAQISTGSGAVRLGPMLGGLAARTSSGEVEVSSIGGATNLFTGTGDVWLGAVAADVLARTGSGDLTVADAASGRVELITGSGEIRVGVRPGTAAEVDLISDSGEARSELDLSQLRPETAPPLRIQAHTRSGSAVATSAAE
jgi:Putative adhesin